MAKNTGKTKEDRAVIALLQDLIKIPSWISPDHGVTNNENGLVDYLEKWLKNNTSMTVEREALDYGRFNLVAKKGKPKLVFLAHTDTVSPSQDFPYGALKAKIHDDKIWGLGAADMKSGIAAMVHALSLAKSVDNVWLFLYADEEFDFLGMKALVKKHKGIRPKLIVSSDGSDLCFGHGCRGLIEFRGRFTGKTGHPAKSTGKSATMIGWECLNNLKEYVDTFTHPVMGNSSFNVAHVLGGVKTPDSLDKNGRLEKVGQAGNMVSDIMDFVLDVRPASPELSLTKLIANLEKHAKKMGLGFEVVEKTHDLGAWYTEKPFLDQFAKLAKKNMPGKSVSIQNPDESGYLDLQMLWAAVGKPNSIMFGGGVGSTAHTPDEHIPVENLIGERDFFLSLLSAYSDGKLSL